jgi:hypothetical protein
MAFDSPQACERNLSPARSTGGAQSEDGEREIVLIALRPDRVQGCASSVRARARWPSDHNEEEVSLVLPIVSPVREHWLSSPVIEAI